MKRITRRQAIKQTAAAIPAIGLLGALPVVASTASTVDAIPIDAVKDVTIMIRNMYANRLPILSRFAWVPCERLDFATIAHYAIRQDHVATSGMFSVARSVTQYCQQFRFLVQKGRPTQDDYMQLQNMCDDIEIFTYYGLRVPPNYRLGVSAKMAGLRSLIKTNRVLRPVNADRYSKADFERDTVKAIAVCGGGCDLLVVSSNFVSAFATWGYPLQRSSAGETILGMPILVYEIPFLPGATVIEAPLLRPFTTIALTSSELVVRNKVSPYWNSVVNYNRVVDHSYRYDGEWFAEMAPDLMNEHHHAWVEGITRFAAA